ncbi:ribonuclease H [Nocardioides flavus (ex Wang et al. 2016)]|uniref:ribonuclease H n=1 Tax=Nocardioides flavus (ex Wang et al. 2016) TaxID=2058780 RepID=A0ABQ3HHS2_9ACTN|nr:ribonuclease HI family protein [Nocardioides flavus (ex Wang et al. 2016)]GHE16428.1 ribonuclease H [Nocardioides flavus (ex Wang et al. 2016)]
MIIAAADGSALGNPGPAGWAWYVDDDCWASGGWPHGTNNMGELMAVLDLLQQTAHLDDDLHVLCDSKYVIDSVTKWMPGWKRKGWKKSDGKPVLNVELMKAIDAAMEGRRHRVRFEWVKGHAGHDLNEAADRRANAAATAYQRGVEPEHGPGFTGSSTAHPAAEVGQVEEEPDLFSGLAADDLDAVPTDEEHVVAMERALLSDEVRSDRAAVAALLHPDWQEVGRSGRLWTREETLAVIGPIDPVGFEVVSTDRLGPDTILLLWRTSTDDRTTLRSTLWVRSGGHWQARFHQGTDEA